MGEDKQLKFKEERACWRAKMYANTIEKYGRMLDDQVHAIKQKDVKEVACADIKLITIWTVELEKELVRQGNEVKMRKEEDYYRFAEITMEFLHDDGFPVWDSVEQTKRYDYFRYLYIIWQSACRAMLNNSEGQSYEEFIETVMKNCGIEAAREENVKKLVNNFKMYMSKINQKSEDYLKNRQAVWNKHEKIAEKNRRGKAYFPAIHQYECALYEFEFLIKKKNQKDDPELSRIENCFEYTIQERLKSLAGSLGNRNFDIEEFRKKYSKFIQTRLAELTFQEVCDYLKNYLIYKYEYVSVYAEPKVQSLGRYKVMADANVDLVENLGNQIGLFYEDFIAISELLNYVIESVKFADDGENHAKEKREGTSFLINKVDKLLQDCEKNGIYKRWDTLIGNPYIFSEYQRFLDRQRPFTEKKAQEAIRNKFLNKLPTDHACLTVFLELTILAEYITLWVEERDPRVLGYSIPEQNKYEDITNLFVIVADFLDKCGRAAASAEEKNADKVCIKTELEILKKSLKMAQLDIDTDNFTHTYYHQEKRSKKRSVQGRSYRIYFKRCIETQYERLYVMIREMYREMGTIDAELLIKNYLESIFARRENEEQLVPNKFCINLDGEFLNSLINSQTGSSTEHRLEDSIFEKRRRIQELAERYNIRDDFCI